MNVLVTGGAGYIGSHAVRELRQHQHEVVVCDNLYRGHRAAVPDDVAFHEVDLRDTDKLASIMQSHAVDCVMHFAALTYVGESVSEPLAYYDNNVGGSVSLLRAIDQAGVGKLVFSSTAATFGEPTEMPITEDTAQHPINPYGRSKLMIEHVLADYAASKPTFAYAALRYFNVAGCATDGSLGEDHDPETHLIPLLLFAAQGKRDRMKIFGDDYPTPDGTCVRDYVHVEDLAAAHRLVLDALQPGDERKYNLGIGRGYSVREVVDAAKRVTGVDFPVDVVERRPGDPPSLYTAAQRIRDELGWQARHTDLDAIIDSAWQWFNSHPDGYAK